MHNILLSAAIAMTMFTCGDAETVTTTEETIGDNLESQAPTEQDTLALIANRVNIDWTLLQPLKNESIIGTWLNLSDFGEGGPDPNSPGVTLNIQSGGVLSITQNQKERQAKWTLKGHMLFIDDAGVTTGYFIAYLPAESTTSGGTVMYLFREDYGYFGVFSTDIEP